MLTWVGSAALKQNGTVYLKYINILFNWLTRSGVIILLFKLGICLLSNVCWLRNTRVASYSIGACMLTVAGFQTFINVITMDDIYDSVAWSTWADIWPHSVYTVMVAVVRTFITFVDILTFMLILQSIASTTWAHIWSNCVYTRVLTAINTLITFIHIDTSVLIIQLEPFRTFALITVWCLKFTSVRASRCETWVLH